MSLAELMIQGIVKKGISQTELASACGVQPSYISNLTTGRKSNPSRDILFRMASALEMDVTLFYEAIGIESQNEEPHPVVVGISGPSCSGKSWLAKKIKEKRPNDVSTLDLDGYYRELDDVKKLRFRHDNPEAVRSHDAVADLVKLKAGQSVSIPVYDFENHTQAGNRLCDPTPIIVVEGLFIFSNERLRKEMDIKLWVDSKDDRRFARRLTRDTTGERKRTHAEVEEQYFRDVMPAFNEFILPLRQYADVIISNEGTDSSTKPMIVDILMAYIQQLPFLQK